MRPAWNSAGCSRKSDPSSTRGPQRLNLLLKSVHVAEHLKKNALDFLEEALSDVEKGKLNLAMFHLEQALQLALKYVLFQLKGSFEKTHDVLELMDQVVNLTKNERLKKIREEESTTLVAIRDSYITSRYYPYYVDKATVEKAIRVTREVLRELGLVD